MTRPDPPNDDLPDGALEDEDAALHSRFKRPPPGKPVLLPEEPPRAIDDTPVSGILSGKTDRDLYLPVEDSPSDEPDPDPYLSVRGALSQDDAALLQTARQAVMGAAFLAPLVIMFTMFALMLALADDDSTPGVAGAVTGTPAISGEAGAVEDVPTLEPSPVPNAEWPDDLPFTSHTVPALIKDRIAYAGAQMGYRFSGKEGTVWAVTVQSSDDVFDPQVSLFAPSGELVAANDNRAAGIPAADLVVTLPETGEYRVLVESSAVSPSTGRYLLALFER